LFRSRTALRFILFGFMSAYLLNQPVHDGQIKVTVNVDETSINDIAAKTGYTVDVIRTKIALYKRILKSTLEQKLREREQHRKTPVKASSAVNIKLEYQHPLGDPHSTGLLMQTPTPGPGPAPMKMEPNTVNSLQMRRAKGPVKAEPTDEWLPLAEFDDGDEYVPRNSFKKRSFSQGSGAGSKKPKRAKVTKRGYTPHARNILELAWHRGIFQGDVKLSGMTNTEVLEAVGSFCELTVKQVRKWSANKKQKIAKMKREGQVIDTTPPFLQQEPTSGRGKKTPSQRKVLETAWDLKAWRFFKNPKLLVLLTGLEEKQVRKWFQNRKDKHKREGGIVDF